MLKKIDEILAENVRILRKRAGLTQETLAESADVSFRTIQQIESRQNWPSRDTVDAIAKALGVDQHLLFVEDKARPRGEVLERLVRLALDADMASLEIAIEALEAAAEDQAAPRSRARQKSG